MKHLIIRNFGPLHRVDIQLAKVNLVIGLQSSGKSCVLRTACFCSWLEKRVMLLQSSTFFEEENRFLNHLLDYYGMQKYLKPTTYIEYHSEYIDFVYDNGKDTAKFQCSMNSEAWRYCRPKVSYITSDRNVVSLFSDYKGLTRVSPHLQEFMEEWNVSRRHRNMTTNILGMGVDYHFDPNSEKDLVTLRTGEVLELQEASSGIQSVLPLFVHTDYLTCGLFADSQANTQNLSLNKVEEIKHTFDVIYERCLNAQEGKHNYSTTFYLNSKQQIYMFNTEKEKERFDGFVSRLLKNSHSEIFLEEPENNLFPPTQCLFVNWILDRVAADEHGHFLFMTTHSPYVLNQMLKNCPQGFGLFLTHESGQGLYDVSCITDETKDDVIFNGVDLFFNFEAYL